MANTSDARNEIIEGVQLFWPKLHRAVENPFNGDMQYEVQIRVPKKQISKIEHLGTLKQQDDGTFSFNLKKKALLADGTPAKKVEVVDIYGDSLDPTTIGNGSLGNVKLMLRDFEIKHPKTGKVTKSGTSVMLTKVQVTDLEVFEPTGGDIMDFEYETNGKKAKGKAKSQDEDLDPDTDDEEDDEPPRRAAPAKKAAPKRRPEPEPEEEETEEDEPEEEAPPVRRGRKPAPPPAPAPRGHKSKPMVEEEEPEEEEAPPPRRSVARPTKSVPAPVGRGRRAPSHADSDF